MNKPHSRTLPFALSLCLAFLLAACSGGSGASSSIEDSANKTPQPGTSLEAHIVTNTSGGAEGRLYGRISAIALEDDQGKTTANLATGNPEFVLSDPLGATTGMELADFGPGKFVAVHLSFLPGSVKLKKDNSNPVDVTIVGGSIKAPFTTALEVKTLGAYRIELRHKTKVDIQADPKGNLSWKPDMVADASGPVLLQDVEIEILSIDANKGTATGLIESMTNLKTTLDFLSNSVLVIEDDEMTVAEFLAALKANDVVRVFGLLDGASTTHVALAERVDPLQQTPGQGRKNKVRGMITALGQKNETFDFEVFEIRIGGRDIPKFRPVSLEVGTQQAKIKYVPRYGQHRGHLPAADLAVDMFVEIEWHGDAPNLSVVAHKINILSDGRFVFLDKITGVVKATDTKAGTITLEKAGGEKFLFGKESYAALTVMLGQDTLLVEDKAGVTAELRLADVKIGEKLWLFGRKQPGANVDAVLVVVLRS